MNIEWNRVTWYSWIAAVIVFGGAIATGIYIGMQVQAVRDMQKAGTTTAQQNPADRIIATAMYSCDGGKKVEAIYRQGKVDVSTDAGIAVTLPQTRSADGGRYANADESFVFWSRGNGAFIQQMVNGKSTTTYANCTQIVAPITP